MPIVPGTYWDLLDRDTPPVKRRAAHSKARTGCLTCKKRKVKCDETKPHCTRCIKSGHGCAGYEDQSAARRGGDAPPSKASKHLDKSSTTRLLPRPKPSASTSISGTGIGDDELRLNLLRASLTPAYLDSRDALYFERFKCQVLADLGAWCGAEYWRHTILREILVDKTVQHAALAAAAMLMDIGHQQRERRDASTKRSSQAVEVIAEPRTETATAAEITYPEAQPVVPLSHTSTHGKAALGHYTAAISGCRRTLATEGVTATTARSSLTAAFFFAVFELVQGNVGEADRLLASGVQLLDHALAQTDAAGAPALVPDDALREIQLAFDRMRITWGLCPYFGGGREDNANANANTTSEKRVRHFEMPSRDAPVRAKQVFWNAFSSDFGQFMVRMQRRRRCADNDDDDLSAIQAQRTRYLIELQAWLPLLADLCAESPGSMVLATTKAYAQTAIVFLNCFLDASELAYDAYLPVFRDIVDTYQRLLPSSLSDCGSGSGAGHDQGHLRLTLDVDLFYIITFTVSKCRDRATRALALRVFAEMTRRQALWTNSGMLAALRALAALEDGGRDASGFVPATARYNYVHSEWDYQMRQMTAVFVPVLSTATQSDDVCAVRVPISF